MKLTCFRLWALPVILSLFAAVSGEAQEGAGTEKKEEGSPSLGDLFNKVKEIKLPDSVSNLPAQLTELKNAYLETSETLKKLQLEVAALREEMDALKSENAELRSAVGRNGVVTSAKSSPSDLLKPIEIRASDLVKAFEQDNTTASESYGKRYLRVIGSIEKFESGVQEIIIHLRSEHSGATVKCHLKRDATLHAEVLPSQGRMISRNDRSTLLSVGRPIAVMGTCGGYNLNVELLNCQVEGLEATRKEEPANRR